MKHYYELDSLRGLASLSVMMAHLVTMLPVTLVTQLITYGPSRIFVAGSEGVILFFILSGFVLYLPFSSKKVIYGEFVIKRIFRIYVPYIVAIVVAFIAALFFYSGYVPGYSDWLNGRWSNLLDPEMLIGHLTLIGSFDVGALNPVIWSLVHEFRLSLIFPLLVWMVIKLNASKLIIISFTITIASALVYYFFNTIPTDIVQSLYYSHMFVIGATLSKYRNVLINKFESFSKIFKAILLIAALFSYAFAKPSFVLNTIFSNGVDLFYRSVIDGYFIVFGGATVIILAMSSITLSKVLLRKPLLYLGKISYSLYLYHSIFILILVHMLHDVLPVYVIIPMVLLFSVITASLSYHYIEMPAVRAGRRTIELIKKNKREKVEAPL